MFRGVILGFIVFVITGCGYVVPTLEQRVAIVKNLIKGKKLKQKIIKTAEFDLYSIYKNLSTCRGKTMDLYIEGDGLAWVTSSEISKNPTPLNPLGLKLFLQDSHKCTLYLARPCQYIISSSCKEKYWTSDRFSLKVLNSFDKALSKIKKISHISSFRLFGYSGGGAIVALLAAKRDDVKTFVTICGNLDINAWTKFHHISALSGSLNPADFSKKLSKIEQIHLIGKEDEVIGNVVFKSYLGKFQNKNRIRYEIFKKFNHHCCWEKNWNLILKDLDNSCKNFKNKSI